MLTLLQSSGLAQQLPPISRLITGLAGDSIEISLIFNGNAAAFGNTSLDYQKYAANTQLGETASVTAKPDPLNTTRLDFLVPLSNLSGADQLSYAINLNDGHSTTLFGSRTWITLAPLRTIDNLNDQISKAKQQEQALGADIKAKQDLINDLTNQNVQIRKRVRPAAVNPDVDLKRITNQVAVFRFTTPIPGVVQAQVKKLKDDTPVDEPQTSPTFSTNHIFTFKKGLAVDENYYVEAVVVDPATNTIVPTTRIGRDNPALRFSLAPTTNQVNATITPLTISGDTIQLKVEVDQSAALQVNCYLVKNPETRAHDFIGSKGSVANDAFGIPSGNYVLSQNFVFSGLLPDQPYEFEVTAADQLGRGLAKPALLVKSTVKNLDFEGPIQVTVKPTDFTVEWASSIQNPSADLVGHFSVKFGAADPIVQTVPIKPTGPKFAGSLPVSDLQKVFQAAKTTPTTPTLTISMDRGNEHLERSLIVTFNVPKNSQSAQEMAKKVVDTGNNASNNNGNNTTGVGQSLQNIGNGVSQPTKTKFSWQDLLQAGLGVILKAI
jgi:hypothetical protein